MLGMIGAHFSRRREHAIFLLTKLQLPRSLLGRYRAKRGAWTPDQKDGGNCTHEAFRYTLMSLERALTNRVKAHQTDCPARLDFRYLRAEAR